MNLAVPERPIPIPEYLEGELRSDIRHEYLAGQVYAMAGAEEETQSHRAQYRIKTTLCGTRRQGTGATYIN